MYLLYYFSIKVPPTLFDRGRVRFQTRLRLNHLYNSCVVIISIFTLPSHSIDNRIIIHVSHTLSKTYYIIE